jgi:hypothetical protein
MLHFQSQVLFVENTSRYSFLIVRREAQDGGGEKDGPVREMEE